MADGPPQAPRATKATPRAVVAVVVAAVAIAAWYLGPGRSARSLTGRLGSSDDGRVRAALEELVESPLGEDERHPRSERTQRALVDLMETQAETATDPELRALAAEALGGLGPGYRDLAVPALIARLGDPDGRVCAAAARGLKRYDLGEATEPARAALLRSLADPVCRQEVLAALARIGVGAALPGEVVACFESDSPDERCLALAAAATVGAEAVPYLERALSRDPSRKVRSSAARGLTSIPGAGAEAAGRALASDDAEARGAVLDALAASPRAASGMVPELARIATSPHLPVGVRDQAVILLGAGREAAVPALVHVLAHEKGRLATHATLALAATGRAGTQRVAELASTEGPGQRDAQIALRRLGPLAQVRETGDR